MKTLQETLLDLTSRGYEVTFRVSPAVAGVTVSLSRERETGRTAVCHRTVNLAAIHSEAVPGGELVHALELMHRDHRSGGAP